MNPIRITVVVGNLSATSRTKALADHIVAALISALPAQVTVIEVHRLLPQLLQAAVDRAEAPAAIADIERADLLVAVTPVYKGSYTGLFKHVFDLVAPEALVGTPVLLAANGGSDRHALVVDHQLRPLFAFFRAATVPSAVYAVPADFSGDVVTSPTLRARVDEAVGQAVVLARLRAATVAAEHAEDAAATHV